MVQWDMKCSVHDPEVTGSNPGMLGQTRGTWSICQIVSEHVAYGQWTQDRNAWGSIPTAGHV